GHVERGEAGMLDRPRGDPVIAARRDDQLPGLEEFPKLCRLPHDAPYIQSLENLAPRGGGAQAERVSAIIADGAGGASASDACISESPASPREQQPGPGVPALHHTGEPGWRRNRISRSS